MGVSIVTANSQSNSLGTYATNLRQVRTSLYNYRSSMNNYWKAEEMLYINNAIDSAITDVTSAITLLDGLKSDVLSVANEINTEEVALAAKVAAEDKVKAEALRDILGLNKGRIY